MKTLLSIIVISGIVFAINILANTSLAFAQEAITGPPPGETLTVVTDSPSYETNDMITILGVLESANDGKPVVIQIFNPTNVIVKNYQVPVDNNGKYNLKINGDFGVTGQYKVLACIHNGCSSTYFNFNVKQTPPVIITKVELDSPFLIMPDNRTCTLPAKPGFINNCLADLIPGKKVQCGYFIGSKTCEPIHQSTGTHHNCFNNHDTSSAPQWFDVYNTQNTTVNLQNFTVVENWNQQFYGQIGPYDIVLELKPHEKCTFAFSPVNEPLAMPLNNMAMDISYNYNNKDYNVSTPSLSDNYNDMRTWQYDGNKWTFAEEKTAMVPEFSLTLPVLLIGILSMIVFYRMKFRK
ncbi:MAG TPA: hypothetical protein VEU72_06870 [Nitrosopumilaceae archaeon]|nr:hypothetical protein [Nitrosopumilaceae archaeon]